MIFVFVDFFWSAGILCDGAGWAEHPLSQADQAEIDSKSSQVFRKEGFFQQFLFLCLVYFCIVRLNLKIFQYAEPDVEII